MNKKWKWGLSLASATTLLTVTSIGLVACNSKKEENNQQNVEPEKQLYTPPEEENIGDNLSLNFNKSDYDALYLMPDKKWNGACVFQDLIEGSPTCNGWYTLVIDKSDPDNQEIFANFIGWPGEKNFPKEFQINFNLPEVINIPNTWTVTDKNGNQITSVNVRAFFLSSSISDWDEYSSEISLVVNTIGQWINTSKIDFSNNKNLEYIKILAYAQPDINDLSIIFPPNLKMVQTLDVTYKNTTKDVVTTFDFSKCQNSNISKRQKYPEKINVDFYKLSWNKIQHNNTLNYVLPNNTPIYFNSKTNLDYNDSNENPTQAIININNTENINYFSQDTFWCSDINSVVGKEIKENQLFLNDNCYYYEDSFLIKTIVHGGNEVSADGYVVNPTINDIKPQLQSSIKIDPIK